MPVTTKLAKLSKLPTRLFIALPSDFDNFANFASNQQVNANNKTRRPPLRVSNMANLTNMVNFANKVNLANSPTSPATNKSVEMTRQEGPFANGKQGEFYECDKICQICQQARV